ncbi:endonuclease/exonuclease/phosphatase family protein [Bizionia sp.]|uniref:endonuclease/exonuclease/phosphatase family protein n=1 Tax=Bizionia sp. TaxID=1954480 RepID=UPI003A924D08
MKQLKIGIQIIFIVAVIIHFTVKDYFYASAIIFYAFPLPIIMLLTSFSIIVNKKWRKISMLFLLVLSVIWYFKSYVSNHNNTSKNGLEIVVWNAGHNQSFEEAFIENKRIPDVLVLIECNLKSIQKTQNTYPNYYFHLSEEEIGIFSKTPLKIISEITSETNSTVLKFSTNNIIFYAVDLTAEIFNSRKEELQFVYANIEYHNNSVVLGDFNTPLESIYFEDFKNNYNHAFSVKGKGFKETWFWNLPLLSLDHIWVSHNLKINKTDKISTRKSDHSMLRTYVSRPTIRK